MAEVSRRLGGESNGERLQVVRPSAPEPLRLLDAEGRLLDSLPHGGGAEMLLHQETSPSGMMSVMIAPPPFGRSTSFAVGRDRLFTGWNGEYRIVAWSLAGQPSMIVSVSGLERAVDPDEADAFLQRRIADCVNEECERSARAMFEAVELPDTRPAFSAFVVDVRRHLWVAEYELEADMVSGWHVFSPEGELRGRVEFPAGLAVHEIGVDHILGVLRNEVRVPIVRRYPVARLR